ncbi:MAG: hypothetical protein K6U80_02975 [Firmicutes bacterium]|nr:hypothetical protein [Bacillota bacterium]
MKIEKALWIGIALLFLYCCWLFYRDLKGLSASISLPWKAIRECGKNVGL